MWLTTVKKWGGLWLGVNKAPTVCFPRKKRLLKEERALKFNFAFALHPETVRTIRDGEPRTATSTFTQLLSSEFMFNFALRPWRPARTIRDGEP